MVDVSDASFRLVCAVVTEDCAEVTDASSESICEFDALEPSSLDSLSWADWS